MLWGGSCAFETNSVREVVFGCGRVRCLRLELQTSTKEVSLFVITNLLPEVGFAVLPLPTPKLILACT